MTSSRPLPSLRRYLQQLAVRWTLVGVGLTVLVLAPCVVLAIRFGSERQLQIVARSAAQAFRPFILEGNIRDAEFQMRRFLELTGDESAVVRGPSLEAIYPLQESDKQVAAQDPLRICWSRGFSYVSTLYPIYYDDDARIGLDGYLEVTLRPAVDWRVFAGLGVLALVTFVIQALGLIGAPAFGRARHRKAVELGRRIGPDCQGGVGI